MDTNNKIYTTKEILGLIDLETSKLLGEDCRKAPTDPQHDATLSWLSNQTLFSLTLFFRKYSQFKDEWLFSVRQKVLKAATLRGYVPE